MLYTRVPLPSYSVTTENELLINYVGNTTKPPQNHRTAMSSHEKRLRHLGTSGQSDQQTPPSQQPSSSFGSRPSNSLARLAFNIYGNSNSSSNSPLAAGGSSVSSSRKAPSNSPSQSNSRIPAFTSNDHDLNRTRYKSSFELTSFDILHTEFRDRAVIAGKNTLQTFNLNQNAVVDELLSSNYTSKNKKQLGSILDVATGYGSYSKYAAAATTTGSILVFNTETSNSRNKLVYKLSDHSRAANTIEFSQLDQHLLLSGSQDGAMKLWDLRYNLNKPILTMHGNSDAVRSLKFSPFHNKKFAAIFDSGVIQKWDMRQATQFEKKLNAHTGPGLSLDWHPELDYIVSGGRDKQLQIWSMNSNDIRQIPEHVIYTASPISKVCFKPMVSSITNITNAEVATSFLSNDLSVQIYSLKRKYIPLYTIENHSSRVTDLSFQNERTLLTSSKDTYFIKDDLSNYASIIDDLSRSSITWSVQNQLLYVNQTRENQLILEDFNHIAPSTSQNSNISTSPNSNTNLMMTPSISMTSNPPLMTSTLSMSSTFGEPSVSPRPGMSRASTGFSKPSLSKHGSGNIRHLQKHYQAQRNSQPVINPYAVPIDLPFNKSTEVLEYLIDNYTLTNETDSFIAVCESNYEIAYNVASYRDAQTWKVIKEGLSWESNLDTTLKYNDDDTVEQVYEESLQPHHDDAKDLSSDDNYNNYSTSNSTNYGKSPSLSDLSDFNSIPSSTSHRPHSFSSSYKISNLKQSILRDNKSDNALDTPVIEEEDGQEMTITKDDILKWDVNAEKHKFSQSPQKPSIEALPILNNNIMRSSPIGLSSSLGGISASPVYSITSTMSNTSQSLFKPLIHRSAIPTQNQALRPQRSGMSELTRQMTNQKISDDNKFEDSKLPPFSPRMLIEKAVDFSIGQGDLVTCCTMLLIFNNHYKIKHNNAFKEIVHSYLVYLQRLKFFVHFTKISQFINEHYPELGIDLTTISKTSSTIRHFCSNCGKLIVNEDTKASFLAKGNDEQVLVGTWFCELCQDRNKCIYCNEILKGLSLVRLKCGHNGHFGCLKNWYLEMGMSICPSGCA